MSPTRAGSLIGLTWYRDPRVLALSDAAQALLVRLTSYSAEGRTDGFVAASIVRQQTSQLSRRVATAVLAELRAGCWVETKPNGDLYLLRWGEFNLSRSQIEERVAQLSDLSAAGGRARNSTGDRDERGRYRADPAEMPAETPAIPLEAQERDVQPESKPVPVPVPVGISTKYLRGDGWGDLSGTESEAFRREWHQRWRRPPTARQLRSLAPIVQAWPKAATGWLAEAEGDRTYEALKHVFQRHTEVKAAEEARIQQSKADWEAAKAEDRVHAAAVLRRTKEAAKE
jgi:hypothetical protein